MQTQSESALEFDNKVKRITERLFKNQLTGKAFAIRLFALLALGFIIAKISTLVLTANLNNMMIANTIPVNSFLPITYLTSALLGLFTLISFILSMSLCLRRVKDIVQDTDIWPFALIVILLCFIPFISYLVFILLALLPTNYLNQEKRKQLLSKIA